MTWTETAELVWTLEAFDPETGLATIDGAIFGRPANREVPRDQLRVHTEVSEPRRPTEISLIAAPLAANETLTRPKHRAQSTDHLRPVKPRRVCCLKSYKRRYARKKALAAASEQLREEIRSSGFILDGGLPGSDEYARLRVLRRFDVVLKSRPTPEQPVTVDPAPFPALL